MKWTEEEFKAAQARCEKGRDPLGYKKAWAQMLKDGRAPKKKNKYGAVPVVVNGIRFASKREAARFAELELLEKAGEIQGLTPHPVYPLEINAVSIGKYTADSWYERKTKDGWERVVEDVKSSATEMGREFRRTVKLMKALYGIDVEVVK